MPSDSVIKELDRIHDKAKLYLSQKQLEKYMSVFTDKLEYTQLNGETIGKKQLTLDQKRYFNRIISVKTSFKRISYKEFNNHIEESLDQHIEVTLRVFAFFKKRWKILRKADYCWVNLNGVLKIDKVKILEETIV